ncbi:MAG TPA: hypothetical protein VM055_01040 [Novosphingobium sp.]|nr:hypothetical protein [Novosphingobium sp.]
MPQSISRQLVQASLIAMLAACGGGGGSSAPPPPVAAAPAPAPSPTPTPAPTPTPTPTPTPLAGPAAIARVGEFAVLGYEMSYTVLPNGNDRQDVTEYFDGTRFRYLAEGVHELLLPQFEWSRLGSASLDTGLFSVQEVAEPGGAKSFLLSMLVPGVKSLPLNHTGFATWYLTRTVPAPSGRLLYLFGGFAYGVATLPANMPNTGTVTYNGFGDVDGYGSTSPVLVIVDFATRRVEGRIVPTFTEFGGGQSVSGTFGFVGTLPAGANAMTADVTLANGKTGKIEIAFTGPKAEELMFRFRGTIPCLSFNNGDCAVVFPGAAGAS